MGASLGLNNILDVNQMKNIQIKLEPPISMINFKNKSEEQRYLRIAKCILKLTGAGGQTNRTVKNYL